MGVGCRFRDVSLIMANQKDKKTEIELKHEIQTEPILWFIGVKLPNKTKSCFGSPHSKE